MSGKIKHEETVIKRASRKHDHEGHGGAWKVAFADFCLALMCLFLVLWVLAARSQERVEAVLRSAGGNPALEGGSSAIDREGHPPGSLIPRDPVPGRDQAQAQSQIRNSGQPAVDGNNTALERKSYDSVQDLQKVAKVLHDLSDQAGLSSNIETIMTPYGLRVMLHDTNKEGMFDKGSAIPSERFRRLLHQMGPMFETVRNQVLIVGHTDSLQYSGKDYAAYSNWSLSSQRAMAARANLLEGGMPVSSVLQVVGMADRAPYDTAHPAADVNRRIELLILTSVQSGIVASMFGMPATGKKEVVSRMEIGLPGQDVGSQGRNIAPLLDGKPAQ